MKGSMPKPGGVRTGIGALPLLLGQPAALLDACSCAEMAQVRQESSRSICYFSLFESAMQRPCQHQKPADEQRRSG